MKSSLLLGALAIAAFQFCSANCAAQPDPKWPIHDRTRPQAPLVTPGTPSTDDQPGQPPSDALILFNGTDISQWVSLNDGSPTKWIMRDGYMECVKGSGYVRTLQNFGDCQLHVEWRAPFPVKGDGQGRGNSGVFFGFDRYELQVLDSYENPTYTDGAAGAVYGQYPPLANVCLPPGKWQTYDIIWTAPRFDADGKLLSPARETAFQNGVLIQNNVQLSGPTGWLERAPYTAHPEKLPIALQDHGNPVRFRNIWVRELGNPGRKEFTLSNALLDSYTGTYDWNRGITITREGSQLVAKFADVRYVMFAESSTHFFAKTADLEFDFATNDNGQVDHLVWSMGEGANPAKKTR